MARDPAADRPEVTCDRTGDAARFALTGDWTLVASRLLEDRAFEIVSRGQGAGFAVIDLGKLSRLDTAGAWLINKARQELAHSGVSVAIERARPEHRILLEEAHYRTFEPAPQQRSNLAVDLLAGLGRWIYYGFRHAMSHLGEFLGFLGEFVVAIGRMIARPVLFRGTSLVYHIENFGLRGIPIIVLMNLIVGMIVAQQGIFQLQRFGATIYAVNLIGVLVLRELGVLLTSIMVAGRSGSAITAEIGSMKMREEIDALRVMGLSPIDVLIAPRVLALVVSLPMLTLVADMTGLFGGMLVTWSYGDISPTAFKELLPAAIGLNTFMVGLLKAPFMGLVIGLVAANDGMATAGSAESLGRQVTASVVKSIFMVIVIDGLFAMFFAAIHY
jgi:phospholipid/cholesterol/gamma-HCH transport system permease protein